MQFLDGAIGSGSIDGMLRSVKDSMSLDVALVLYPDRGSEPLFVAGGVNPQFEAVAREVLMSPGGLDEAGRVVSLPIGLPCGARLGSLICPHEESGNERGESRRQVLEFVSDLIGRSMSLNLVGGVCREESHAKVREVIEGGHYDMVFQPVTASPLSCTVGYEALLRVTASPNQSPDRWLDEAESAGLRIEFELGAIERALKRLSDIPNEMYLAVNVSPATVLSGRLESVLNGYPLERIVLEVTEHDVIDDYEQLRDALAELRRQGLRLAIDDACSGYASFRHILRLNPDVIKMDRSVTAGIDQLQWHQALAELMVRFADRTGCVLIAEGVETVAERDELHRLGFRYLQGYLLGVPGPFLTEEKG